MITIPLALQRPPLTTNRMPRNHAHRARIVREIQNDAGLQAIYYMKHFRMDLFPIDRPVTVCLVWTVPDNRVRDSSGPDPTLKAAQDALVNVGFLKDDRHEVVTRSYCRIEKGEKYGMRLEIESLP